MAVSRRSSSTASSSSGSSVDEALTLVHEASGLISYMVVKKALSRRKLVEAHEKIRAAVKILGAVIEGSEDKVDSFQSPEGPNGTANEGS